MFLLWSAFFDYLSFHPVGYIVFESGLPNRSDLANFHWVMFFRHFQNSVFFFF